MECDCQPRIDPDGTTCHKGDCAIVSLSKEARQRVWEKMESVRLARLYAMAHAHETVIG